MNRIHYLFLFLILLISGCSSTEQSVFSEDEDISEQYLDEAMPADLSLEVLRSRLSDVYAFRNNEVPETFKRLKVEKEVERNLYEGYRVQIYSGRSVEIADTLAADFRVWADSTISGYDPQTYVSFRTPYYKVHVGDFHDREKAISFSAIVKRVFRDAWVVYDKVDPSNVPADTTNITIN